MKEEQIRVAHLDDEQVVINWFRNAFDESSAIKFMGSATNGDDFIERFKRSPLDVVLIDIQLGYDTLEGTDIAKEFLKQYRPIEKQPKVIFFTKHNDNNYKVAARELNASLIGKKVRSKDLIEYIKIIHRGAEIILVNPKKSSSKKPKDYGVKLAVQKLLMQEQITIAC